MDRSERPQTGVTLIVVSVVDTAAEGRLWIQEGGIMCGVLVLFRLALLAHGISLLRHKGNL